MAKDLFPPTKFTWTLRIPQSKKIIIYGDIRTMKKLSIVVPAMHRNMTQKRLGAQ